MLGVQKQKWLELCKQAGKENDPDKLTAIVAQIATLMQRTEYPLRKAPTSAIKRSAKKAS